MSEFLQDVKYTNAVLNYEIDLTDWLGADTLTTATATVPAGSGLVVDSVTILAGNKKIMVVLSGGIATTGMYLVTVHFVTVGGLEDDKFLLLECRDGIGFDYDPATDIGKVRLLVDDRDPANLMFKDAEIQAFLDLESDNIRLAAARALETMATNQVMILKRIKLLDLETDGSVVARELRALAKQFRDQEALADTEWADFDIAEQINNEFGWREKIAKDLEKSGA